VIGVEQIAEAAKAELGDAMMRDPVRVSCPSCGRFIVAVFVVPNLIRGRCEKCHMDAIALIGRDRSVLSVTASK
jgi:4-hydroxy-3-methylbut-2-en-1-yl diphosphate synthase IspG/GcpE